jgi:hypothetical protein
MKKRRLLAIFVAVAMVASMFTLFTNASADAGSFTRSWGNTNTYLYDITIRLTLPSATRIWEGQTLTLTPGGTLDLNDVNSLVRVNTENVPFKYEGEKFSISTVRVAAPNGGPAATISSLTNPSSPAYQGHADFYKWDVVDMMTPALGEMRAMPSYTTIDVVVRGSFLDNLKGDWTVADLELVNGLNLNLEHGTAIAINPNATPQAASFNYSSAATPNPPNRIAIQAVTPVATRVNATRAVELNWNAATALGTTPDLRNLSDMWYWGTGLTGEWNNIPAGAVGSDGISTMTSTVFQGALQMDDPTWGEAPYLFGLTGASLNIELLEFPTWVTGDNRITDNRISFNDDRNGTGAQAQPNRLFVWTDLVRDSNGAIFGAQNMIGTSNAATELRDLTHSVNIPAGVTNRNVTINNIPKDFLVNPNYDPNITDETDVNFYEFATEIYYAVMTTGANGFQVRQMVAHTYAAELIVTGNRVMGDIREGKGTVGREWGNFEFIEYEIDLTVNFGQRILLPEDSRIEFRTVAPTPVGGDAATLKVPTRTALSESPDGVPLMQVYHEKDDRDIPFELKGIRLNNNVMATGTSLDSASIAWVGANTITPDATQFTMRPNTNIAGGVVGTPLPTDGYDALTVTLVGTFGVSTRDLIDAGWKADDIELSRFIQMELFSEVGEGQSLGLFQNRLQDRWFTISAVRTTGTMQRGNQSTAGFKPEERQPLSYHETIIPTGEFAGNVASEWARLRINARDWKWSEAPFVAGMLDGSLDLTFMPGVNPNGGGNANLNVSGTQNLVSAANSNRIYLWTDLVRGEHGEILSVDDIAGPTNEAALERAKAVSVQAPNNRSATAQATVSFNELPIEFFFNADYDETLPVDHADYRPEFATNIYIAILGASTGAGSTGNLAFAARTGILNSAINPHNHLAAVNENETGNGIYGAKLEIEGIAIGMTIVDGVLIISDIEGFLNEDGELDLVALLAQSGADYVQLSADALAAIKEAGEDVKVVFDADGNSYTIVADSIEEDAADFKLDVTIANEVAGWLMSDNAIVLKFAQHGEFGLEIVFDFTLAQLGGLDIDELGLYYVSSLDNSVKDVTDDSLELVSGGTPAAVTGVKITISSASFYVLDDEPVEVDPDNIPTTVTTTTAAPQTTAGTGTVAETTPSGTETVVTTPSGVTTPATTPVTTPSGIVTTPGDETTPAETTATGDETTDATATTPVSGETTPATTTSGNDVNPNFDLGMVRGEGVVRIGDALQVLTFLARLPSVFDDATNGADSLNAAIIRDRDTRLAAATAPTPNINDALEILTFLAKLDGVLARYYA